jgi:hypothetical protein
MKGTYYMIKHSHAYLFHQKYVAKIGDRAFNIFQNLSKVGMHKLCQGIKYIFSSKNIKKYIKGTGLVDNYTIL